MFEGTCAHGIYVGDVQGSREIKVSTSTVAALFSKMALTGQRIATVDMAFLVFTAFAYLPQGWMEPALRAKGALISEPRFSTPCEMRFFPRGKGENGFCRAFFFEKGRFPFLAWGKSHLAGG